MKDGIYKCRKCDKNFDWSKGEGSASADGSVCQCNQCNNDTINESLAKGESPASFAQQTYHGIRVGFDQAVSELLDGVLAVKNKQIEQLKMEVDALQSANSILRKEHQSTSKSNQGYKEVENYFGNTPNCIDCHHHKGISMLCFTCDEDKCNFQSSFKPL
ncbi:MAG: hypothetical protein ACTSPB_04760 [Candidatus Thorarchaeota archaeon]